jgi:hypothetical protein
MMDLFIFMMNVDAKLPFTIVGFLPIKFLNFPSFSATVYHHHYNECCSGKRNYNHKD